MIDCAILQACGLAANTIVAGGRQACDPHERGYGPLRAHEPIIIDIFPRSQKTGYFGDITRTVVRGRASEAVRRLYDTVLQGQKIAFRKIRANAPTGDVHRAVQEFFEQQGYKTRRRNGRMEGFFHGTGHGLGLEIHESPRAGHQFHRQAPARPRRDRRAGAVLSGNRRRAIGRRRARHRQRRAQPDAVREGAGNLSPTAHMKVSGFEAIVRALNAAKVRYLVAGGLAVNAHGYVRFTNDVDLVVRLTETDILAAFKALENSVTGRLRPSPPENLPTQPVASA